MHCILGISPVKYSYSGILAKCDTPDGVYVHVILDYSCPMWYSRHPGMSQCPKICTMKEHADHATPDVPAWDQVQVYNMLTIVVDLQD